MLDPETKMVDHTDIIPTVLGPTVLWESQDLEMACVEWSFGKCEVEMGRVRGNSEGVQRGT